MGGVILWVFLGDSGGRNTGNDSDRDNHGHNGCDPGVMNDPSWGEEFWRMDPGEGLLG